MICAAGRVGQPRNVLVAELVMVLPGRHLHLRARQLDLCHKRVRVGNCAGGDNPPPRKPADLAFRSTH